MLSIKSPQLSHAFKEWAVAVEALEAGDTILLLRKGGIRETAKNFQINHTQVWLYPTYEHQKPHLLKPEYADKVTIVESGWHPENVRIGSLANITQVISVQKPEQVNRLQPYHIWNEQMVNERFKWKHHQPLSILLLRVYRLWQPIFIPYHQSYGGCRSWIDLQESLSLEKLEAVLDENTYKQQVNQILSLLNLN
ncbi:MAG: DUF1802 family protein [Xenococcaceae cyanobacterium MO_188.B29]|nr:DUF1802 family protein [Xenococcaceae cyanobacterium MO_188.B29]